MQDIVADLDRLAGKVAERLVVRALQQLVGGAVLPLAITIHAEADMPAAPKLLGAGRQKPGPKPGKRAKPGPKPKPAQTPAVPAGKSTTDLAQRQCRQCFKKGTAQALGDGQAKCTSCGHVWTLRRSKLEAVSPVPQKRPTAKADAGDCTRCDHPLAKHVEFTGACLTPRCVCAEAVS